MKKIVFFGSSPFSTIVLEKILHSSPLQLSCSAVVTTPDKPVGRHLKLTPNPVKLLALKNNIPIYTSLLSFPSPNLGEGAGGEVLGLVAAFGQIIPQNILDKLNNQIYNIHPSLLPKYRGPSPLQQQILDGVTETGVTIIQLDSQMDHGPIILQSPDTILSTDTWISLGERLFAKGADLILNSQFSILNQTPIPQNHNNATYTKKITRQDGFLPWNEFIKFDYDRKFRAYYNWPGIWSVNPEGERVKLISLNPPIVQYPGKLPHEIRS